MGVGKTFRLTVQERILIHLHDFTKYIDKIEVPFELTQEGIANSVGVVRSAIPRAIKKLISKQMVNEMLAHVTGVSRRRKVYYLNTEGIMAAMGIKEKLFNVEIKIKDETGQIQSLKVKDAKNIFKQEISLLDIILNLDSENPFDIANIKKTSFSDFNLGLHSNDSTIQTQTLHNEELDSLISGQVKTDKDRIIDDRQIIEPEINHFIDKAPKLSYFIGRKSELEFINNSILNKNCKIIIIYGIAGIGKTTLAAKVLEDNYNEYCLFWYRFHEWDTLRNILSSISKFLDQINLGNLKNYLDSNQNIDINDVGEILESDLKGLNALFFFDDFHKINEQLLELFILLREILERISSIKLLIFSRSFVGFYDRRDVIVKELINELELEGLTEEESKQLLKHRNIILDNFEQFYQITKGHPLSLELLDPTTELAEQKNIKLYLEEEVLARLSLREKSLLRIASVFRYPVPADGFFIIEKAQINRETLSLLTRKSLIKESLEGYEIHDLIRDFFYSYLTSNERITYHKIVGQFYLDRLKILNDLLKQKISSVFRPQTLLKSKKAFPTSKPLSLEPLLEQRARGILETQYHFLMSKDLNRVAEVAIILGGELLNLTYVDELLNILNKIDVRDVSYEYIMDLKILKGDALTVSGDLNEAQKLYQESLVLAQNENNKTKLAELYCKLGYIKEKLNEYNSAIELLYKSLEISQTTGNAKGISDAYGSLGDVYWKMSEFDKSNEFYNKSLESADAITDLPGKAKTYLTLGIQSAKHGQFEESIKYYERCLDILEKDKSIEGINYTNFYESLGDHYLKTIFSYYIKSNGKNN